MKACGVIWICFLALWRGHVASMAAPLPTFSFTTVEAGKQLLTSRDEFIQRLSPFDRSARLKTDREVSEKEFLEFVSTNVLAWPDTGKSRVATILSELRGKLEPLGLPWPETVELIHTSGREEGGAAYTRTNAIILPASKITGEAKASLQRILIHELFHVLSRHHPQLREELYGAIGFKQCVEIEMPEKLKATRITNPDAPRNDYCIRLQADGKPVWAVPILFSRSPKYDLAKGGEFFQYLQFQFLLVERDETKNPPTVSYDSEKFELRTVPQLDGFYEQVGRNTTYIIHPEEILADNFVQIVLGQTDLQSPEVARRIEAILKRKQ